MATSSVSALRPVLLVAQLIRTRINNNNNNCFKSLINHNNNSPFIFLQGRIRMMSTTTPTPPPPPSITQSETVPSISVSDVNQVEIQIQEDKPKNNTEEPLALDNAEPLTKDASEDRKKNPFLRRRKIAIMLSYCGQTYLGMQRNPGTKTIEDDLLKALLSSNYIDEEAYKSPRVMQFQRAARTDKHVSAARQIVSLKMPDVPDLEKLNSSLPPEIRVMGAKKVTKGFCAKGSCDGRTYLYMLPTFAFTPLQLNVQEDYRISPDILEKLREVLNVYLGTKNFHNFTSRRKPTDPSSKRYIISFTASDPFMKDGLEYLILRVKGQSFMLHQIRKMIGLVIAYMRGFAGVETFEKSWSLDRVDIPKAPGVGLVLDLVHYDRYNQRYGADGMHQPLTWEGEEAQVEKFCQEFIYTVITREENEEKSMFNWLSTLPFHTYDFREEKRNLQEVIEGVESAEGKDVPYNPRPRELSAIGKAGLLVEKINEGKVKGAAASSSSDGEESDDHEDDEEDDVGGRRNKRKRPQRPTNSNEDEDDAADNAIAQEVLKMKRTRNN